MPFRAPVADQSFVLTHVAALAPVLAGPRFGPAAPETADPILAAAGRLAEEVLAPLNRVGDRHPARLDRDGVRAPPGFAAAHRALAAGGWIGMAAPPEQGGSGLPMALVAAAGESFAGANLALHIQLLLSQSQIEALEHHADARLKALVLPRLVSGDWCGTMNLTEAQAGSDLGALSTRAEAAEDGSFRITGQKIFISWGDHDLAANISHLVLARRPGAPAGTRGLSLFLVPKILPAGPDAPERRNALRAIGLERKLGLHGAPTCVMAFEGATGWLVGEPDRGMAAMFTMMNAARLGVAMQGVGIAEAATQAAVAWAQARRQGATGRPGPGTIIDHADVRRMLATMRAETFAARALALDCAAAIDMGRASGDPAWAARAALLTPLAKSFATDIGNEVAQMAIQVHGGMGVIEETGVAQYARDVRVTAIYEGTNGIQALDLVGRKMQDGGEAALRLIDEVQSRAETARGLLPDLAGEVRAAAAALRAGTATLLAQSAADRAAAAVPYQRAFARVLSGHYHLAAALADPARLPLARLAILRLLPEHRAALAALRHGSEALFAIAPADLSPGAAP